MNESKCLFVTNSVMNSLLICVWGTGCGHLEQGEGGGKGGGEDGAGVWRAGWGDTAEGTGWWRKRAGDGVGARPEEWGLDGGPCAHSPVNRHRLVKHYQHLLIIIGLLIM